MREDFTDPNGNTDDVVIKRMPLFGFLSIPDSLNRQFRLPKGCVVTQKTLEMRKTKFLGGNKYFVPLTASMLTGGYKPLLPIIQTMDGDGDDEGDMEGLPVENIPPYEPLILWTDSFITIPTQTDVDSSDDTAIEDSSKEVSKPHQIEVIPSLASKLRPHQREGVQFLFECTMGLRGFEGQGECYFIQ